MEIIIIYNIFQDSIVDSGQSSASRSLLGSVSLGYMKKGQDEVLGSFKVREDDKEDDLPLLEMMVLLITTMTGTANLASRWLTILSATLR
jgi:hypothetical protein